jgi:hypothetical protein
VEKIMLRWIQRAAIGAAAAWQATLALGAAAETSVLSAVRDATLIESGTGALANGAGPALFIGRTSQQSGSRRRALLLFDVAGALPGGAVVTGAWLDLELSPSHPDPVPIGLHRVAAEWSEGPSASSGGSGAPATLGDVTWIYTRYDTERWTHAGGDFAPAPSAVVPIGDAGPYRVDSSPTLVADVQHWLDAPATNHGWILVGGEDAASTVKRFYSREAGREGEGPRLVVEYVPPCDTVDLSTRARGICTAYCEALDCDAAERRGGEVACQQLAERFAATSGEVALPCEHPAEPECPCFTIDEVTALVQALQDSSVYADLDCTDSSPTKPLTAVSAVRIDGADCSAGNSDCSALSVSFTEDNACQLNPPAPALPVSVDGISDVEREACRDAILAGAHAAGLACE